jgi:polysaccharide biosynthesis/export protein
MFVCFYPCPYSIRNGKRKKTMERNSMRALAASAALLLLTAPCRAETPVSGTPAGSSSTADNATYLLQPGDVVEISVWKEEGLDKRMLVRPDGGLSFPMVGDLKVAGLAPVDVQHEIEARLRKFLSEATVTVSVMEINGNQFYVVGKVARPGAYKFDRALDVMQALSLAGGTTEFADLGDIRILRRGSDGRQRTFPFAYSDVARGRHLEQNIVLESGDTLVVP